ncbi:GNAT family N-acetyltransferase [Iamia majanohamensis]|uniref:GNAT family N-acetyltransferase n=1 Tax=Iamia majanohamensis TaxID=467976 RepID=A0AAE9YDK7_9ACTN|nr:GNAT family N-acetyltransferase [Iamia majanohamensis]WCO65861.1 GNAT family N-acetyltransferase [Iamia majanohamensis]
MDGGEVRTGVAGDLVVRRAREGDRPAILDLARRCLGWGADGRYEDLFRWKHDDNPFGASPRWVALQEGRVVGFRTFLRWRFRRPDGSVAVAVRAVDTATHPDHQGRGIFRRLTLGALEEMVDEGVDFVFNTPNDSSRPGYLKMGWVELGRPPLSIVPVRVRGAPRMARSRTAAELWSEPSRAGRPATEALADDAVVDGLLARVPPVARYVTDRDRPFLRWRYGNEALRYRALAPGDDPAEGLALFRVRRRGASTEAVVADLMVPEGDRAAARHLVRRVARTSGADYALVHTEPGLLGTPALPAPGLGPRVTWRALAQAERPELDGWRFTMGDLELF